jgi:FAD-dependent urate hydroxylase
MNFDGMDLPPERSEMPTTHPLLIIGAGPFGLAVAADALYHGLPVTVIGEPMAFWRENMPRGMVLRSASDWHLDPQDAYTIEVFLADRGARVTSSRWRSSFILTTRPGFSNKPE